MSKSKVVQVRLPVEMIERVKRAAKMAGITPTQAFNLLIALDLAARKVEPRGK